MSGLNNSSEYNDVYGDGYVSDSVSVTTSAIEAKVGGSRLANREGVTVTNKGPQTVYYGPSGVTSSTGDVLYKDQSVSLPLGDIEIFLITSTSSATVIVQEFA